MPVSVIWNASQAIAFIANLHFCNFIAKFSLSSWYSVLSISFSWSDIFLFVMTNMSSRNAKLLGQFYSLTSIVFWKVAGMSVSP